MANEEKKRYIPMALFFKLLEKNLKEDKDLLARLQHI